MIAADNPWKEVCERKLPLVFALLYPGVFEEVDWSQDYDALDQDLRKFSPASTARGRIADRLIRSHALGSGDPRYFHLEVQGKKEAGFRRRIHLCNLRAEERFDAHIVSLVILTDRNPRWRPRRYVAGQFPIAGDADEARSPVARREEPRRARKRYLDERTLRFLTVKLIDFRGQEADLETLENPMGLFVVAHLEAMRTRSDEESRQQAKFRLLLNLRKRKMDGEDLRFWHTCLDWFLQLPQEREQTIHQELERLDKEEQVPYLSFIERNALEQGLEKGMEKGMEKGILVTLGRYLVARFGNEALTWLSTAEAGRRDEARLMRLCEEVFAADTAEQVRALLAASGNGDAPGG